MAKTPSDATSTSAAATEAPTGPDANQPSSTETTTPQTPQDVQKDNDANAAQADASNLPDNAEAAGPNGLFVGDPNGSVTAQKTEAQKAAEKRAQEEEAARMANPDKTVYRRNDDADFFNPARVSAEEAAKAAEDKPQS